MSAERRPTRVARILVALDASPASVAAAAAAASLAARLRAELEGVFVEDADLLALAAYPAAQEVGSFSATVRGLASRDLERQLRLQAERARRALERHAGQFRVRWSFRVVRGRVSAEILAAAAGADLVSLGRSAGWAGRRRLGSVARALLARGTGRVLLLPHQHPAGPLRPPAVVLYHGDDASRDALAAGVEFAGEQARGAHERLVVLLPPEADAEAVDRFRAEVDERLAESDLVARFQRLGAAGSAALARAVAHARARILFLPVTAPVLAAEDLAALVERLDCAVMLVR
jgi:hypothetical protein